MTFERLCMTCNTIFFSSSASRHYCSEICADEGRRAFACEEGCNYTSQIRLDDGDEQFADADLDGAFLEDSRMPVDGMIEIMSVGRRA